MIDCSHWVHGNVFERKLGLPKNLVRCKIVPANSEANRHTPTHYWPSPALAAECPAPAPAPAAEIRHALST